MVNCVEVQGNLKIARRSAQITSAVEKSLCHQPGIEPGTSQLPVECSTTELPMALTILCSDVGPYLHYRIPFPPPEKKR